MSEKLFTQTSARGMKVVLEKKCKLEYRDLSKFVVLVTPGSLDIQDFGTRANLRNCLSTGLAKRKS